MRQFDEKGFVVVAFSKVVYKFISTSYVLVRGNAIPGFFWAGKFGKYFFGWPDLSRDFFGCSKIRGIKDTAYPVRAVL